MNQSQLINQDSGKTEYYTPSKIVEAARAAMGGIDLDPASSTKANETVKATTIYTITDNGLSRRWHGRVWMNHPFSRENNAIWIEQLRLSYLLEYIDMACCITYAATSERWFRPLLNFPQCYLSPRTNYYLPDGTKKKGVTKGSVVTFVGPRCKYHDFFESFRHLGSVMIPYRKGVMA